MLYEYDLTWVSEIFFWYLVFINFDTRFCSIINKVFIIVITIIIIIIWRAQLNTVKYDSNDKERE